MSSLNALPVELVSLFIPFLSTWHVLDMMVYLDRKNTCDSDFLRVNKVNVDYELCLYKRNCNEIDGSKLLIDLIMMESISFLRCLLEFVTKVNGGEAFNSGSVLSVLQLTMLIFLLKE